jgi:modification methylase
MVIEQISDISSVELDLAPYIPKSIGDISSPQTDIPGIAKDPALTTEIENALKKIPTEHQLYLSDSRSMDFIKDNSIHLVMTSPPYWTLKKYNISDGQLGDIADYDEFLKELDKVWQECYRILVPGGRLICVVGDVCLSRRNNNGRHTVVPLHASIQEHCMRIGFDNLAPIIWSKIANVSYEVENGSAFLGKPYEPNAVVKNDIEYILFLRKPGGYRNPSIAARILSVISVENHRQWFQQIWNGLPGEHARNHPAPYPLELAERLIRMFSFAGDTILDPFMGSGTTNLAASLWGRNSIGVEVDPQYFETACSRMSLETKQLFSAASLFIQKPEVRSDGK